VKNLQGMRCEYRFVLFF